MLLDPYHQRASECLQFAESCHDAENRITWRELALCWLRLSEHTEQIRNHCCRKEPSLPDAQFGA